MLFCLKNTPYQDFDVVDGKESCDPSGGAQIPLGVYLVHVINDVSGPQPQFSRTL